MREAMKDVACSSAVCNRHCPYFSHVLCDDVHLSLFVCPYFPSPSLSPHSARQAFYWLMHWMMHWMMHCSLVF